MRKVISIIQIICILTVFSAGSVFSAVAEKTRRLNQEALVLLQKGKLIESILLWEQIPKSERTAEISNNIGYAYYKRSRQYFDGKYGIHSYLNEDYVKAKMSFIDSEKMDPKRWSVYLNHGDLDFYFGLLDGAKKNYEKLLKLNPNYKYAEKIIATIKLIERETRLASKNDFEPFIVEIHPSLPLYIFRIYRNPEHIDVLKGNDTAVIQSLIAEQDIEESNILLSADINFDGYMDVAILEFTGSGHNYGYCYWLFNKNSGEFEQTVNDKTELNHEIVGPYIDYVGKKLSTSWSGSDHQSTSYYNYKGGKFVNTENINIHYLRNINGDKYRKIIKTNVNGKMKVISDKIFDDPDEAFSNTQKKSNK